MRDLLPLPVVVVQATPDMWNTPLRSEEEAFLERAVEKRRREFRAGRACARRALQVLGLSTDILSVGPDRAPVWPAGVVGSITHSGDFCAAAVAWREAFAGIGIDAERRRAIGPELVSRICTPAEQRWIKSAAPPPDGSSGDWPTLVFSAKECLYKALPSSSGRRHLDFQDANVSVVPNEGVFCIEMNPHRQPWGLTRHFRGRFRMTREYVLAALTLPGPGN